MIVEMDCSLLARQRFAVQRVEGYPGPEVASSQELVACIDGLGSVGSVQGYLAHKKARPHYDHHRALAIGLL